MSKEHDWRPGKTERKYPPRTNRMRWDVILVVAAFCFVAGMITAAFTRDRSLPLPTAPCEPDTVTVTQTVLPQQLSCDSCHNFHPHPRGHK